MKISLPMLKDNFLTGIGYNQYDYEFLNYQEIFFQDKNNAVWAHKATENGTTNNQFLRCFLELGIIGGCIFIVLWLTVLYHVFRVTTQNDFKYAYWFLFAILTLFFHCFIDETFQSLVIVFLFIYIISLFPNKLTIFKIRFGIIRYILVSIIIIIGIFIIKITFKTYQYSYAYKYECLAVHALSYAQYDIAMYNCRTALFIDSASLSCKTVLGRTLIAKSTYEQNILKDKYLKDGIKLLENNKHKYHNRDLYLALSYGYLKIGDTQKSLQYALRVHRMFPTQLRPELLLGICYYSLNKSEESRRYIMDCINRSDGINSTNILQINRVATCLLQESYVSNFNDLMKISELNLSMDSILIAH
jgi:hypothetical protein